MHADNKAMATLVNTDLWKKKAPYTITSLFTHTHTQPFYSSLNFVQDNTGELVPEGTFRHLLDFLVHNENNTGRRTNNPDGPPPHPD